MNVELWSGAKVAEYLGYSYAYFMNTYRYQPGVPQPIDKPGHPRWRASDWLDWAGNPARITQKAKAA